jgi:RHS repeat-associated protein
MLMIRTFGFFVIVIVGVIMLINGAFMLVSPRAWFRLPRWLGKHGSMTEEKYSTGWGALDVRLGGAITLAVIAWILYESLLKGR